MVVDLRKSGHKHKDRESFTREVLCWLLALDVSMYRSAMVNLCQDPPVERADVRTKSGLVPIHKSIRIRDTADRDGCVPRNRIKHKRTRRTHMGSFTAYSLFVAIADHVERAGEESPDVPEDGHTHPHDRRSIFRGPAEGRNQSQEHARHQRCTCEKSRLRHLAYRLHRPRLLQRASSCEVGPGVCPEPWRTYTHGTPPFFLFPRFISIALVRRLVPRCTVVAGFGRPGS